MQELACRRSTALKVGILCLLFGVAIVSLQRVYSTTASSKLAGGALSQKTSRRLSNARSLEASVVRPSVLGDGYRDKQFNSTSKPTNKPTDKPTNKLTKGVFHPLTANQVEGVEKFVFFTGYPRSGHSIVGSFLDAHPNIVLSYAFFLFRGLLKADSEEGSIENLLQNKVAFFNTLFKKSYNYARKSSRMDSKGYTLDVPGVWSGNFDRNLKVIGDKSALPTSFGYESSSPSWFKQRYQCLSESVGLPLMGIHVVRNPFDMIATHTMYRAFDKSWKQDDVSKWTPKAKHHGTWSAKERLLNNESLLRDVADFYLEKARAVHEMMPLCKMNVLEVHNEDFVMNPRRELQRLCHFLEVDCSEHYLKACESKTYRNVSRTRDLVYWPPDVKLKVEEAIKMYPFFKGYNFVDDFYTPS